jgi:hypothetical protein
VTAVAGLTAVAAVAGLVAGATVAVLEEMYKEYFGIILRFSW